MPEVPIPNADLMSTSQVVEELCDAHSEGHIRVNNGNTVNRIRPEYRPVVNYDEENEQVVVERRTGITMARITLDSELTAIDMNNAQEIIQS